MNPGWAAAMLRLAFLTGDALLADIAHNSVAGRFTNYPGYYYRQQNVTVMQPDFPVLGPFDASTLYYHHAPGQLGLALDYLVTEHEVRSQGRVRFPGAFEENFVWFRYRTYGHRPGQFHDLDDVWLWTPKGIVSVDNHKSAGSPASRTGPPSSSASPTRHRRRSRPGCGSVLSWAFPPLHGDAVRRRGTTEVIVEDGVVDVEVPAWGHVGLAVHDVGPLTVRLREDTPDNGGRQPHVLLRRRDRRGRRARDPPRAAGRQRARRTSSQPARHRRRCTTVSTTPAANGQWTPKAPTPRSGRSSSLLVSRSAID